VEVTEGRLNIDSASSSGSGVWEDVDCRKLVPENRRLRTLVGLNTGELNGDFCDDCVLALLSSGTESASRPEAEFEELVCFSDAGNGGIGMRVR